MDAGRGGREYRGLRTRRYTYVRSLDGPWLLFDNQADPYQLTNLVDRPECSPTRAELDALLQRKLDAHGDQFLPGLAVHRAMGLYGRCDRNRALLDDRICL